MTTKNFYEGRFNWFGEVHILYRYAFSEAQAKELFIRVLSSKVKTSTYRIRNYYKSHDYSIVKTIRRKPKKKEVTNE